MSRLMENDDDEEEEYDVGFDDDMEALRQACILTGTNPDDVNNNKNNSATSSTAGGAERDFSCDLESEEDDFELFRNVQKRFSTLCEPLSLKPLCTLPPVSDDEEDDFEILAAVRRRFAAYDNPDITKKPEQQVHVELSSNDSMVACEVSSANCEEIAANATMEVEKIGDFSGYLEEDEQAEDQSDGCKLSALALRHSSFPESAQVFFDAIKKNRSCQKFLRSKLTQIEARIEENKKLKDRVKILKDFQASCRKMTGRALALRKDPRIQLISARKTFNPKDSKGNDKKVSAMYSGPVENCHVANYKMALTHFPILVNRKKWTEAEKKSIGNGIRQQFQEMMLQFSVDQFSGSDGSPGDTNNLDNILTTIRDLEITPEKIREFLPKVNWDQLASLYVPGHSGAECEARWLNFEDPLINCGPWTTKEDKNLLFVIQEKGVTNWFDIAVSLGTNRTPFQCLARFQRSLNARIIKSEWTKEEDAQLRAAVETYGESNWQCVASILEGRTGTQCSNRWKKTLHPDRRRVGRWTLDEDKRLKVAVKLFGPKNWRKIAQFVPGRTEVQCRERWVNSLDPSLNWDKWTEEEDLRLIAAIEEYGYRWSKVAECLSRRTDNQCWRRWKVLAPDKVPSIQMARRMQKAALISNFVDRESERPALGPKDFVPLPLIGPENEGQNVNQSRKLKRKSRGTKSQKETDATPGNALTKIRSKRLSKKVLVSSEEVTEITNGTEVDNVDGNHAVVTRTLKSCSENNPRTELVQDHSSLNTISMPLMITSGKQVHTRKKQFPAPHAKGNKFIETDSINQSIFLLAPESLEAGITNGDVLQTFGENSATSSKTRRAPKQHSKRNLSGTLREHNDMLSGTNTDDTEFVHYHLDSNLSTVTNGEGSDILGQADASSKNGFCKPCTKRKIRMELAGITDCLVFPTKVSGLRSIEPLGEGQCVVSVPCQQDNCKKSKPKGKSCSQELLGTQDEDNVTLASFLQHKSKKRKLEVATNANQGCSPFSIKTGSESPSKGVGQLNNGKRMSSFIGDSEAQTSCNGGISENILSCEVNSHHSEYMQTSIAAKELHGIDTVNCGTLSLQEPVRELANINQEGDDITLSSLLCKKPKRHQTLSKSDSGTRMKKGSK